MNEQYNDQLLDTYLCRQQINHKQSVQEYLIMKQQFKILHDQAQNQEESDSQQINLLDNKYVKLFSQFEEPSYDKLNSLFNILLTKELPPILRQRWYQFLITDRVKCEVTQFQTFIKLPNFQKFLISQQIEGLDLKDTSIEIDQTPQESSTSRESSFSCQVKNNAEMFCKYNQQIIFDIRRTLKELDLFQEDQPLYQQYCQCITILSMRYNKYIQGLGSPCAVLLLSLPNCKQVCQVAFRITQSRIYQSFLNIDSDNLVVYSNNIYKCVLDILQLKQLKQELEISEDELKQVISELNNNLYTMMQGSLSGLVLTCFSKVSIYLSNYFFDLLCCTVDKDVNILFIKLLCAFYIQKIVIYLKYNLDTDWLLQEVTKQRNLEGDDFYLLQKIMVFIHKNQLTNQLIKRCIQQSEVVLHQ